MCLYQRTLKKLTKSFNFLKQKSPPTQHSISASHSLSLSLVSLFIHYWINACIILFTIWYTTKLSWICAAHKYVCRFHYVFNFVVHFVVWQNMWAVKHKLENIKEEVRRRQLWWKMQNSVQQKGLRRGCIQTNVYIARKIEQKIHCKHIVIQY